MFQQDFQIIRSEGEGGRGEAGGLGGTWRGMGGGALSSKLGLRPARLKLHEIIQLPGNVKSD